MAQLMDKRETLSTRLEHVGPSCTLFFKQAPLKMVRGSGAYLYDETGLEYLDCINNVAHVGHSNERVRQAVHAQLGQVNSNSRFLHDNLSLYAQRLAATLPAHLSVCYLVNSGSEANDLALRLARAYTRHKDVLALDGAYHGNLSSTMAFSAYKTAQMLDSRPPKWVHVAPLPCSYRAAEFAASLAEQGQQAPASVGQMYAHAARRVMDKAAARGRKFAACYVESMVSCGGQMPLPEGYLAALQAHLRHHKALLICDEVQTGFGRCGSHMWAFQSYQEAHLIEPDIVTLGKPMANGLPVSAVVTRPEIAQAFHDIGTEYFNTFGGSPVSCGAALAVLDEIRERDLMANANKIGHYLLEEFQRLARVSPHLGDVRGRGLFLGLELVECKRSRRPARAHARFVVERLRFEDQILISAEGKHANVLKFKPPMVFSMDDAKRLVGALERALQACALQQRKSSSSASSVSSGSWLESSSELET